MTDEAALLLAILANRAEDTPRLVYADWLEEHGQPERARFIRIQIQLAREGDMSALRRDLLRWHEEELLRADHCDAKGCLNWLAWAEPIRDTGILIGRPWQERMAFSRGFVSSLTCSWSDWLAHHAAILARQPVERVKLTTRPLELEPLWQLSPVGGGQKKARTQIAGRKVSVVIPLGDDSRLALVQARWPDIEFELPPVGQTYQLPPDWTTRDYTEEGLAAMREAGERAAIRENQRILNAVFGLPPSAD